MTIPEAILTVTLDVNDLTLDEVCLFSPGGFDPVALRTFLVARTSWTAEEVGKLQVKDLQAVFTEVADKIQDVAVPLAKSPRSNGGRGMRRKKVPAAQG